jgi:hypothetical protein
MPSPFGVGLSALGLVFPAECPVAECYANFQRTLCQGRLGGSTKQENPPAWDTTK